MSTQIQGINPKFSQAHIDAMKSIFDKTVYMQWLNRSAAAGMIDFRCNISYDAPGRYERLQKPVAPA